MRSKDNAEICKLYRDSSTIEWPPLVILICPTCYRFLSSFFSFFLFLSLFFLFAASSIVDKSSLRARVTNLFRVSLMVSWSGFAKRFKGITKSVIFKQGWGLGRLSIDKGELGKVNYKACVFHFRTLYIYIFFLFFMVDRLLFEGKEFSKVEDFFFIFYFFFMKCFNKIL